MSTYNRSFPKDPDETLDFSVDWSGVLDGGEIIIASTWAAESGITVVASTFGPRGTTIWVAGGTAGAAYLLTNRVSTTSTPTHVYERTIRIVCDQH